MALPNVPHRIGRVNSGDVSIFYRAFGTRGATPQAPFEQRVAERVTSADPTVRAIQAQRALSYLPQRPNFHPHLTCAEIMGFYAQLRGIALSRGQAMLDQIGLREFDRVRIGELSGGTRQRLGLALLLLPDAPVLLLDEPGLSLDPTWRKRLQETLRFEAARGKTVLVTTHLVAEWNNVAHRCLLCCDGKIERELDPRNLPHNFDEMKTLATSLTYEPHFSVLH